MKMRKILFFVTLYCFSFYLVNAQKFNRDFNQISIEKSPYGLIFTNIRVNGETVKALIDFGDPHVLQLSDSFAKKKALSLKKTDASFMDVQGNSFQVFEGEVESLTVGGWTATNVTFQSSPGEIDGVAKQVNTDFKAVLGWGYFAQYYTLIDYTDKSFTMYREKQDIQKPYIETSYNKESGHLAIPVLVDAEKVQMLIDTGSPVTVIDTKFSEKHYQEPFVFTIDGQKVSCKAHKQDLSVLQGLGVGIIGGDVIGKYKMWIDPFMQKIYFKE